MSDPVKVYPATEEHIRLINLGSDPLVLNIAVSLPSAGSGGSGGVGFDYTKEEASTVWTIAHNMGVRPGVTTLSTGGLEMQGKVLHLSENVVQITFLIPVAGTAHLA